MRSLITGAGGFIGSFLVEHLAQLGHEVFGVSRGKSSHPSLLEQRGLLTAFALDIADTDSLKSILVDNRVELVFHLAGVRSSDSGVYRTNVFGTHSLLEAVRLSGRSIATVVVGSCAAYGEAGNDRTAIDEDSLLKPVTAYGVSKAAADLMAYQVFVTTGLPVYRARLFNVIGPRQSDAFFCSTVARQLAEIERGTREPILKLGSLSSHRDFLDVLDAVTGLASIALKGQPGDAYNLCSGRATSVKFVVEYMAQLVPADVRVESSSAPASRADVSYQVGSYAKVRARTGWEPTIDLEKSLRDIVDYWRTQAVC